MSCVRPDISQTYFMVKNCSVKLISIVHLLYHTAIVFGSLCNAYVISMQENVNRNASRG